MNFQQGQLVKTSFLEEEKNIVRTIHRIEKDSNYGSGIKIVVSNGSEIESNEKKGTLLYLDSPWVKPIEGKSINP